MDLLKKPPLVEASCEILFMPTPVFDTTIPGMLYAHVNSDFPIKRERPTAFSANKLDDRNAVEISTTQLSQFFSNDGSRAIQVGKDVLVINVIQPYHGWEDFKKLILEILDKYCKNLTDTPKIRRVTLKYINSFIIDLATDYKLIFSFSLPNPNLPQYQENRAFNIVVEFNTQKTDILAVAFKTVIPPNNETRSFILEFANINNTPQSTDVEDFSDWLTSAHQTIEEAFVASLKEEYYQSLL